MFSQLGTAYHPRVICSRIYSRVLLSSVCVYSAKITLDDAVQHLYHFCATLPTDPYVDLRPIFTIDEGQSIKGKHLKPRPNLRSISVS